MKRAAVEAFLVADGWTRDTFGHYHKGEQRFKMQKISLRLERKIALSGATYGPKSRWVKCKIAYFSELSIVEGKLHGLHS